MKTTKTTTNAPGDAAVDGDRPSHHLLRRRRARGSLDLTCPTCGRANALSPADARRGYQCGRCADLEEGVGYG